MIKNDEMFFFSSKNKVALKVEFSKICYNITKMIELEILDVFLDIKLVLGFHLKTQSWLIVLIVHHLC